MLGCLSTKCLTQPPSLHPKMVEDPARLIAEHTSKQRWYVVAAVVVIVTSALLSISPLIYISTFYPEHILLPSLIVFGVFIPASVALCNSLWDKSKGHSSIVKQARRQLDIATKLPPEEIQQLLSSLKIAPSLPIEAFRTIASIYKQVEEKIARLLEKGNRLVPKQGEKVKLEIAKGEIVEVDPIQYTNLQVVPDEQNQLIAYKLSLLFSQKSLKEDKAASLKCRLAFLAKVMNSPTDLSSTFERTYRFYPLSIASRLLLSGPDANLFAVASQTGHAYTKEELLKAPVEELYRKI